MIHWWRATALQQKTARLAVVTQWWRATALQHKTARLAVMIHWWRATALQQKTARLAIVIHWWRPLPYSVSQQFASFLYIDWKWALRSKWIATEHFGQPWSQLRLSQLKCYLVNHPQLVAVHHLSHFLGVQVVMVRMCKYNLVIIIATTM